MLTLSISIVIYENTIKEVQNLLFSLEIQLKEVIKYEILIIDNNNRKFFDCFKLKGKNLRFIINEKNIGFGRAHNQAINFYKKKSKYHLILNPDIIFKEKILINLIAEMDRVKKYSAISPYIYSLDNSLQFSGRLLPNFFQLIARRFISKILPHHNYGEIEKGRNTLSNKVLVLSGAFILARTNYLVDLKGFDERFFLYMEDIDLSRRLLKKGNLAVLDKYAIYHKFKKESYSFNKAFFYHSISAIQYFLKWGFYFDKDKSKLLLEIDFKKNICIVATSPFIIENFFKKYINYLSQISNLTIVTTLNNFEKINLESKAYKLVDLKIERKISLFKDLITLLKLTWFLRINFFDVIISLGPKAGLIGTLSAYLINIKKRLFIFQGEVWSNKTGAFRFILKNIDRLIVYLSTHLLCVNPSEKVFLFNESVDPKNRVQVLGYGSICGIPIPNKNNNSKNTLFKKFKLPKNAIIALYLGRLNKEKGILDLFEAFLLSAKNNPNLHLFFVGPDEENLASEILKKAKFFKRRIHFVDYTNRVEIYLKNADFGILPSYREGLPKFILESFAYSKPVIATNIYGINFLVKDGVNGLLVKAGDIVQLAKSIETLSTNRSLRIKLGKSGRKLVLDRYREEMVTKLYINFFNENLLKN